MAVRIPKLGTGNGQTGDNEFKIRSDYNNNFSDRNNAASRLIGDANGNASAVFTTNPTGAGVDLKGITGENVFLIDNGTSFKSSLTSDPSLGSGSSIGEASSLAIQSTTVTVEKGNSSFISSFQEAF